MAYPDEDGKLHLEPGYFRLMVGPEKGGLKTRVQLRGSGSGMNQTDFRLKNYLQQDIGTE
jgi:hypothetical protein